MGLFFGGGTGISNVVEDATPQIGGDLDLNAHNIDLNIAPADTVWEGIVTTGTAGENVAQGALVYLKSDGKWWKTDCDAEATTKGLLAIATGTINAEASGTLLLWGVIKVAALWDFAAGDVLWVDNSQGIITKTPTTTAADFRRIVGFAKDADTVVFIPSSEWVEVV